LRIKCPKNLEGDASVKEVPISEFRTKCLALIESVRRTRQSLRVTRRGKPIVDIVPTTAIRPVMDRAKWLGSMKGTAKILGDIVSPAIDKDEWEVLRDPLRVLDPRPHKLVKKVRAKKRKL
jgi:prevent-host-death family protein